MNHFAQQGMSSGWMGPAQVWPTRAAQFNNVYEAPQNFQYSYNQNPNVTGVFASGNGHHPILGHQNGGLALAMPHYPMLPQSRQGTGPNRRRAPAHSRRRVYNKGVIKPIPPKIRPKAHELKPDEDIELVRDEHVVCEWATAAGPCGQKVLGRDVWSHVRKAHAHDLGPEVKCRWPDCHHPKTLRRASMSKHLDVHLGARRECCRCGYTERQDAYLGRHGLARKCVNPLPEESGSEESTPGPQTPSSPCSRSASSSGQSDIRYSPYPTAGSRMAPQWTAPKPEEAWDSILASTVDSSLGLQAPLCVQQHATSSQFAPVNQPLPTHIPISPVTVENASNMSKARAQTVDLAEANPIPAVADPSLFQSPEDDATFSGDNDLSTVPVNEQPAVESDRSVAIPSHNENEAAVSSTVVQHAGTAETSSQPLDAFDLFDLGPDLNAFGALDGPIDFSACLPEIEGFYAPLAQL